MITKLGHRTTPFIPLRSTNLARSATTYVKRRRSILKAEVSDLKRDVAITNQLPPAEKIRHLPLMSEGTDLTSSLSGAVTSARRLRGHPVYPDTVAYWQSILQAARAELRESSVDQKIVGLVTALEIELVERVPR